MKSFGPSEKILVTVLLDHPVFLPLSFLSMQFFTLFQTMPRGPTPLVDLWDFILNLNQNIGVDTIGPETDFTIEKYYVL